MDLTGIIDDVTDWIAGFAHSSPIAFILALAALVFFIYQRPKLFLFIFILGTILAGVLYAVSSLSMSGTAKKEGLIEKSVTTENIFRSPLPRM